MTQLLDYLVGRFQHSTRAEYDQEGSLEERQPHGLSNHNIIPSEYRQTDVYSDYNWQKTMNLFLTFVDLSYVGMAKMTPYVYYDPLLFFFFVNSF